MSRPEQYREGSREERVGDGDGDGVGDRVSRPEQY